MSQPVSTLLGFQRKLLTKPIWYWESRRTYPIRDRIFELPPLKVNPEPETVLSILTTPETLHDSAWAARSLLEHLPESTGLLLVVNGTLEDNAARKLDRSFPGIIRQPADQFRDTSALPGNLGRFVGNNPLGHKPAMIMQLQKSYNIVFSDFDVLAFGPIPEVADAIAAGGPPLYIQDVGQLTADRVMLDNFNAKGCDYAATLNGGFHFIPRDSLSFDLAEDLLEVGKYDPLSWHTDQTLLAALMKEAGGLPLPKPRYVVSSQRQFYFETDVAYDEIAVRHFIGPVRHLMYSRGMPLLWDAWRRGGH